jgi:hypothetical protein
MQEVEQLGWSVNKKTLTYNHQNNANLSSLGIVNKHILALLE